MSDHCAHTTTHRGYCTKCYNYFAERLHANAERGDTCSCSDCASDEPPETCGVCLSLVEKCLCAKGQVVFASVPEYKYDVNCHCEACRKTRTETNN